MTASITTTRTGQARSIAAGHIAMARHMLGERRDVCVNHREALLKIPVASSVRILEMRTHWLDPHAEQTDRNLAPGQPDNLGQMSGLEHDDQITL